MSRPSPAVFAGLEVLTGGVGDPQRDRPEGASRDNLSFGPWIAIDYGSVGWTHRGNLSGTHLGSAGVTTPRWSFFSLLQKNVLDTRRWDTQEELRHVIVTWIETKYNRQRRHSQLGYSTPIEHELRFNQTSISA